MADIKEAKLDQELKSYTQYPELINNEGFPACDEKTLCDYINTRHFITLGALRFTLIDMGMNKDLLDVYELYGRYKFITDRIINWPDPAYGKKDDNGHWDLDPYYVKKGRKEFDDNYKHFDKPYDRQFIHFQDIDEDFNPNVYLCGWVMKWVNDEIIIEGCTRIIKDSRWAPNLIGFVHAYTKDEYKELINDVNQLYIDNANQTELDNSILRFKYKFLNDIETYMYENNIEYDRNRTLDDNVKYISDFLINDNHLIIYSTPEHMYNGIDLNDIENDPVTITYKRMNKDGDIVTQVSQFPLSLLKETYKVDSARKEYAEKQKISLTEFRYDISSTYDMNLNNIIDIINKFIEDSK